MNQRLKCGRCGDVFHTKPVVTSGEEGEGPPVKKRASKEEANQETGQLVQCGVQGVWLSIVWCLGGVATSCMMSGGVATSHMMSRGVATSHVMLGVWLMGFRVWLWAHI